MAALSKYKDHLTLLKDGVISESEFSKLKTILFENSGEGFQSVEAFEEYLRSELFREALLKIEANTLQGHTEAISILELLGDWRNSPAIIEQCRSELHEMSGDDIDDIIEPIAKAPEKSTNTKQNSYTKKSLFKRNVLTSEEYDSLVESYNQRWEELSVIHGKK